MWLVCCWLCCEVVSLLVVGCCLAIEISIALAHPPCLSIIHSCKLCYQPLCLRIAGVVFEYKQS